MIFEGACSGAVLFRDCLVHVDTSVPATILRAGAASVGLRRAWSTGGNIGLSMVIGCIQIWLVTAPRRWRPVSPPPQRYWRPSTPCFSTEKRFHPPFRLSRHGPAFARTGLRS